MLSFECIKNEKSVYFLLTSADLPDIALKESQNLSFWTLFLGIFSYAQFLDVQDFNSITFYEIHCDMLPPLS